MTIDARALLEGAVDTHVHSAPDLVERKLDDVEVLRQARDAGMAAVVLKNHFFTTALRANLVESLVPGIRVVGSIVLNQTMGGVNPWAVEGAARGGAKVVWMPTAHSENQLDHEARSGTVHRAAMVLPGRQTMVRVFDGDGRPTRDTEAVLEIVRDRGLLLATGHLSPDEVDRLTARAIEIGVRRMVVTHPDLPVITMPIPLQKRLAERGVYFERTFNVTRPPRATLSPTQLAARIREVGRSSTIMATDFGQVDNPPPLDGFLEYIQTLLDNGFTEPEIREMSSTHARELLGV
jgi:hypothetical protein